MTTEQKLLKMSKQELGELLNKLQSKIDSGRFEARDVQVLNLAVNIYVTKFEEQK
jgi:hypothetical protein